MADVVKSFRFLVPPGNGVATSHTKDCELGTSDVTQIDLVFPAGCAGLVGVQLTFTGNPVYPNSQVGFFILDNDRIQIPVSGQGNSGSWGMLAFNEDYNQHIIDAYFYYNYVSYSNSGSSSLVSL